MSNETKKPSEEQIAFANTLDLLSKIGFIFLIVAFIIYISGVLPNAVALNDVPNLWHLSLDEYIAKTHVHTGWEWIKHVGKGDYLSYLSIALLAIVSIICFIVILPIYIKKKDMFYTFLVIIQIIILLLAASNIISVGGH